MANSANAMVLMIYFSNFRQLTINEDIENNKYLYSCSQCDYDARWKSILKKTCRGYPCSQCDYKPSIKTVLRNMYILYMKEFVNHATNVIINDKAT